VQILSSQHFQTVMAAAPPTSPVGAATYAQYDFPSFSTYEEPTAVSEDFSIVKSSAQIDGTSGTGLRPHRGAPVTSRPSSVPLNVHRHAPSISELQGGFGFFNPPGVISPFRADTELESEVRAQDQLVF
jgi:hypothetical protein